MADHENLPIPATEDWEAYFAQWESTLPQVSHSPIWEQVAHDLDIPLESILALGVRG